MLLPQSVDQGTLRMPGKFTRTLLQSKRYDILHVNANANLYFYHTFPQQSLNSNAVLLPVHWNGLCLSDIHAPGGIHTRDNNELS